MGDGVCVHVHSVVTVHAVTISGSWSVCAVAGRFLRLLVDGANRQLLVCRSLVVVWLCIFVAFNVQYSPHACVGSGCA